MGKKGSGKSTLARHLAGFGYEVISFAMPIKDICVETLRMSHRVVYNGTPEEKETTFLGKRSYRQIMQDVGTFFREIDPDIWVRNAEQRIKIMLGWGRNVVIDDLRFPNEAEMLVRLGAKIVRVVRDSADGNDTHVSETALDTYRPDITIFNNGLLTVTEATLWNYIDSLRGNK